MKFSTPVLVAYTLLAALASSAGERLLSLEEVSVFLADTTPRQVAFEITGKVIYLAPVEEKAETTEMIISNDADVRTSITLWHPEADRMPAEGDQVHVVGKAIVGKSRAPLLIAREMTVLEHGTAPEVLTEKLSAIDPRRHHLSILCTSGTVLDVFADEIDRRFQVLLLKDEDVILPISIPLSQFGDQRNLIGATIRITGIYRRAINGVRRFSWPNLQPRTSEDIEVIAPPPADPFSFPPLEDRPYLTPEDVARMSRRSIVGEVLATWSGDHVMLRTSDEQIIHLQLAKGGSLPACGKTILAVGQPETDLFRINLGSARWKDAEAPLSAATNESAAVNADTAFWDENGHHSIDAKTHGRLMVARGIIRTLPAPDDRNLRFIVDTGKCSLPIDVTSTPSILEGLEIGCTVEVTGRCLLLTESDRQDHFFPQAKGVALVVRTPADLVLLSRPSWWTPLKLLVVISVLIAALIGIYIWNRILRRIVNLRGRELYREQVAHAIAEFKTGERTRLAVELHDSLSQTLGGVACQVAAGAQTLRANPDVAERCIETAGKMLQSCRTELRQCLFDLRSDTLEEPDFSEAIRKTLVPFTGSATIAISCDVPRRLFKDTTAHAILAIVRELTGNAVRHGAATEIRVSGQIEGGQVLFSVRDNGCGFDPSTCDGPLQGHFGLEGIRNRLEKLNGTLSIESKPDEGTLATISLALPYAQSPETPNP